MPEHVHGVRLSILMDNSPDYNHTSVGGFIGHYSRLMFECERKKLSFSLIYNGSENNWTSSVTEHNNNSTYVFEKDLLSKVLKSAIHCAEECIGKRISHG